MNHGAAICPPSGPATGSCINLNDSPPVLRVLGRVGRMFMCRGLAVAVRRAVSLPVFLCIGVSTMAVSAIELPGFLTPRKSIATHGGTEFTLRIQARQGDDGSPLPIPRGEVARVITVLQNRLKDLGSRDARVSAQGDAGITVQAPAATPEECKTLRRALETVGQLKLQEVSPRNDETDADGKPLAARVAAKAEIVPGYTVLTHRRKDEDGHEVAMPILVNRRAALGSNDIERVTPCPQQPGAIAITLNKDGTGKMIALTKNMTPGRDRIAIVLDGVVLSAPVVNQVPLGKNFIIEGLGEPGDIQGIMVALRYPLELAVSIEEERAVPPPKDSK